MFRFCSAAKISSRTSVGERLDIVDFALHNVSNTVVLFYKIVRKKLTEACQITLTGSTLANTKTWFLSSGKEASSARTQGISLCSMSSLVVALNSAVCSWGTFWTVHEPSKFWKLID
jgi:hypothetical protein